MTITEFLLARIADDEAAIDASGTFGKPDPLIGDQPLQRMDYDEMVIGPVRMLAECEAKRRIVAEWERLWREAETATSTQMNALYAAQATGLTLAIRTLAQPYADHPDFDPDWRL